MLTVTGWKRLIRSWFKALEWRYSRNRKREHVKQSYMIPKLDMYLYHMPNTSPSFTRKHWSHNFHKAECKQKNIFSTWYFLVNQCVHYLCTLWVHIKVLSCVCVFDQFLEEINSSQQNFVVIWDCAIFLSSFNST